MCAQVDSEDTGRIVRIDWSRRRPTSDRVRKPAILAPRSEILRLPETRGYHRIEPCETAVEKVHLCYIQVSSFARRGSMHK